MILGCLPIILLYHLPKLYKLIRLTIHLIFTFLVISGDDRIERCKRHVGRVHDAQRDFSDGEHPA